MTRTYLSVFSLSCLSIHTMLTVLLFWNSFSTQALMPGFKGAYWHKVVYIYFIWQYRKKLCCYVACLKELWLDLNPTVQCLALWEISNRTLNVLLAVTGSQWREHSSRVTWFNAKRSRIIQKAAFWIRCLVWCTERPDSFIFYLSSNVAYM